MTRANRPLWGCFEEIRCCGTPLEGLPTAKKLQSIETLSFYRRAFGIVVGSLCGIQDFGVASSPSESRQAHWSSQHVPSDALQHWLFTGWDANRIVILFRRSEEESGSRRIRDALKLARLIAAGPLQEVYPPTSEQEAVRELCRCRQGLARELTRARHQVTKLLLRRGLRFQGGRNWTQRHRRTHTDAPTGTGWSHPVSRSSVEFKPHQRVTFAEVLWLSY